MSAGRSTRSWPSGGARRSWRATPPLGGIEVPGRKHHARPGPNGGAVADEPTQADPEEVFPIMGAPMGAPEAPPGPRCEARPAILCAGAPDARPGGRRAVRAEGDPPDEAEGRR